MARNGILFIGDKEIGDVAISWARGDVRRMVKGQTIMLDATGKRVYATDHKFSAFKAPFYWVRKRKIVASWIPDDMADWSD